MALSFNLDFNPQEAHHRRAADWLSDQPDPAEAVARLVTAANEGALRLTQWEELVMLLAKETRDLRAKLAGLPPEAQPDTREDPESAQRLDSMFG